MSRRSRRIAPAALAAVMAAGALVNQWPAAQAATDPQTGRQWGLSAINAPQAWAAGGTGAGVKIAVVDSGADLNHEDLRGKIAGSVSCVGSAGDPARCSGSGQDDLGHGTHVAGIAAAATNNGVGVAGVAPDAQLLIVKSLAAGGSGSVDDIVAGIKWAADHGAGVINLSLADSSALLGALLGGGIDLREGVDYAYAKGSIVVLASGNTGGSLLGGNQHPKDLNAIFVGAVRKDGSVPSYSSPLGEAKWAMVAPGGANDGVDGNGIYSTYWKKGQANQYFELSGTSMAAPHVSGVLAAVLGRIQLLAPAARPVDRAATAIDIVLRSGRALPGGKSCGVTCVGALDAGAAMAKLPAPPAPTTTTTRPPAPVQPAPAGSASDINGSPTASSPGYLIADEAGLVRTFGSVGNRGQLAKKPNQPVVGLSKLPSNRQGYWLVASDGGVFSFGEAAFYGSTGNLKLNQPIVGMTSTPTGRGYWMVAKDGGIFSYGDARFFGSTGAMKLNQPIVGMASTPSGRGYWLVASDGGIFSFGDARFFGSTGAMKLNQPIVGMASTPTGRGYWLVASDGGMFSFGDARFSGSTGGQPLASPIVGMSATVSGGYYLVAADGGIFNFGSAAFLGSATGSGLGRVVGVS